jgi:hypothetical protein
MNNVSVAIARKISDDNKKVFNRKKFDSLNYKDSFRSIYQKNKETANDNSRKNVRCFVEELSSGIARMSDYDKSAYINNIYKKYRAGKKLTAEEMNYLKNNDPDTYLHAMRVKMKRAILEEKLKNAKTRREAEMAYEEAQLNIDNKDPDRDVLQATYYDVWYQFARDGMYSKLQTDEAIMARQRATQRLYESCNYSAHAEYADGQGEVKSVYEYKA